MKGRAGIIGHRRAHRPNPGPRFAANELDGHRVAVDPTIFRHLVDVAQRDDDLAQIVRNPQLSVGHHDPHEAHAPPADEEAPDEEDRQQDPLHVCLRRTLAQAVAGAKLRGRPQGESPDPDDRDDELHQERLGRGDRPRHATSLTGQADADSPSPGAVAKVYLRSR
jgi:hypothetical protein